MRVSELASKLGKTSKEILEIIKTKDKPVASYVASSVTKDQENIVHPLANPKRDTKSAVLEHKTKASKTEASRTEAPRTEALKTEASKAEAPKVEAVRNQGDESKGEPAKKRLTAVLCPQNVQQQIKCPVPPKPQGGKQGHIAPTLTAVSQAAQPAPQAALTGSVRPQVQAQSMDTVSERTAAPQPTQVPQAGVQAGVPGTAQDSRDIVRSQGDYQGSRGNNRSQTGYQGSRDNNRGQGGYQGSHDNNGSQGGYQDSHDNNGSQEGYQGSRDSSCDQGGYRGGQGGYQSSRDSNRSQGGYQEDQGGYQGSCDNNRPQGGGYQGSRGQGGYQGGQGDGQGDHDNNRPQGGGYQGSRSQGGYQRGQGDSRGDHDNSRPQGGGYQGSRSQGNYQGGRRGCRDNRNNNRPGGGYQGNRNGARSQGGHGNRPQGSYGARLQGGCQGCLGDDKGARDNRGRTNSRHLAGVRDGEPSLNIPVQTKPSSNRQDKNAYENARLGKRDRLENGKRKVPKTGKEAFVIPQPKKEESKAGEVKTITLPDMPTIEELAGKMKFQPSAIVKKSFLKGRIVTLNQEIDYEQAEETVVGFGVLRKKGVKVDVIAKLLEEDEENTEDVVPRPLIVRITGHADHGKTFFLDAIRRTNATAKEAGGIAQHIGVSATKINGRKITFLGTLGREAFTAIRTRGAQSTDIAILIVAVDDDVTPQTVEAINHIKAANAEIIMAINKIDKSSANVDKVKQELVECELILEDWGGNTIFVPIPAYTKEGIKDPLETVPLTADVLELKTNPNRKDRGLVIEAELDRDKGLIATVLVRKGTLGVGETIVAGTCFGKIRTTMDGRSRHVRKAGLSTSMEILGLNNVLNAGEVFVATENEKEAKNSAEIFISGGKSKPIEDVKAKLPLDDLLSQIQADSIKELSIIVKAGVQGFVEAAKQSLTRLSNEEVMVKAIHGGVSAINEPDVSLASASNAVIIDFSTRSDVTAKFITEYEKVDIRLCKVVYQAIKDVGAAMKGILDPVFEEKIVGHAVIRQAFKTSGTKTTAGSYVLDGKFQRNCSCRVRRNGEQTFKGPLASPKRFKDDVKGVATGYEYGLIFEKFNDPQEDDEIEAYTIVGVPR